jgi:hypothetical protein
VNVELELRTGRCRGFVARQVKEEDSVAYVLKARTVKAEKQTLLGNGPYTRSRGTRHAHCDVMQQ